MSTIINQIKHLFLNKRYRQLFSDSWKMGWPLILIMLFEFAVSITDVYIAGKLGKTTQAAVGFVSQIYFVFIVIANAITIGTVSVLSRIHAEANKNKLSCTVYTLVVSVLVSGFVLAIAAFFIAPALVLKSSVPDEVRTLAASFLKIYLTGLLFHYFLIHSNGMLRATKRVLRSLLTMTAVALVNIALNLLFYFKTDFGYKGIAYSTVASYIIGALINSSSVLPMMSACREFSRDILKSVLKIGWPSLIQQISWQAGSVVMFMILGMLPSNSVDVMAGFTTGLRIESAIFLPAYALNMTAAAVSGNLLGAKRPKDAYYSGIVTSLMSMCIIIVLSLLVILNASSFGSLLSDKPAVINECVRYLIIQMISEPFMAVLVVLSGTMVGAGDTLGVMRIVTGGMWFIRVPLSYILAIKCGYGPVAVWWVMNFDIFIRLLFTIHRYRSRKWIR
jgi:multidrug resistance protein, MATE family